MEIQASAGEQLDFTRHPHPTFAAVRYIFTDEDMNHYQHIAQDPHIYRSSEIKNRGESLVTDSSNRHGFYIVIGEGKEEVCNLAQLPLYEAE